jgi:diguanylate cyclase (GGDEF)-like protein/PAS domain S-box-containing protein
LKAEPEIQRRGDIYAALNQCNQAIMRCTSEDELFGKICQATVQSGGMSMAWVGITDAATLMVRPVASYGSGVEYLDDIRISADADEPVGRGMVGAAIRESAPVWIQDFQKDPRLSPWHERAARFGWAAAAALPLYRNGAAIGALALYTDLPHAFDEVTRNLLDGMVSNLNLVLDRFTFDTQRKQAEAALRENEMRTRLILDMAMDAVIGTDQTGRVIDWNPEAERMFGYAADQVRGRDLAELIVPPAHRQAHLQGLKRFVETGTGNIMGRRIEITGMRADGSEFPIEMALSFIRRDGKYFFNAFIRDITEWKATEADLRVTAATFNAQEAILITDDKGNILRVNRAFEESTGYEAAEVIGKNPRIFQSGQHDKKFYQEMWATLGVTGKWSGEIWDMRKNGEIYPKMMTITAVYDKHQRVSHYVAVSRDISRRKQSEAAIHQLAFYDPLTGLPNRRLLMDRLQQSIAVSVRDHRYGAIMLLDLDHFKILNDTKGHEIGDLLLKEVATRLSSLVQEGDTVARLGGDEFVVILEALDVEADKAAAQAEHAAEKIRELLVQPYLLNGRTHHTTPSIGITLFKGHLDSLDDLLRHADIAMYQAKSAGRNAIRFYDPETQSEIEARAELETELRLSLEHGQFQLHYQIQVDSSLRPIGAEVLLRWLHPQRGLVSPAQFIPLAEETGLIVPIGLWVLHASCMQLRSWQEDPLTRNLTLAVNVSAKQFRQHDFVHRVRRALHECGAKPSLLKLELTESMVLENVEDTIAKMRELKQLGVSFSMDDFGTGYSSLQYLKRLPLDQIKIDRSFVRDIANDPNDAAIVKTIIAMAEAMGLDVIAEGVESEAQQEFLGRHGCHAYQGYLFGKPLPIGEFEGTLHGSGKIPALSKALP